MASISYRLGQRPAPARLIGAARIAAKRLNPALTKIRPVWQAMTPVGRATAVIAVCAWLLGLRLGWQELFLVAACAGISMLVAVGFVLGRPTLDLGIDLERVRVEVGTPATGQLIATNRARVRMRPLRIDVPVGANRTAFELPSLAANASHREVFQVATSRRCVITIGPARAVRTDPLGLLRRHAIEPRVTELFVHPRIIGLEVSAPACGATWKARRHGICLRPIWPSIPCASTSSATTAATFTGAAQPRPGSCSSASSRTPAAAA